MIKKILDELQRKESYIRKLFIHKCCRKSINLSEDNEYNIDSIRINLNQTLQFFVNYHFITNYEMCVEHKSYDIPDDIDIWEIAIKLIFDGKSAVDETFLAHT